MSTRILQSRVLRLGLGAALALAAVACGPEFDPPSKLQSLRILAVKKDDPYLRPTAVAGATSGSSTDYRPDNTAHMVLAMEDARLKQDEQVPPKPPLQKVWFGGCNNPPRDNYFSCMLSVWLSFKVLTELGPGVDGLAAVESWSIGDHLFDIGAARIDAFLRATFPELYEQWNDSDGQGTDVQGMSQEDLLNLAMALRVGAGDTFDYTVPDWVIAQHTPSTDKDIPLYGLSQVFLAVCDGKIGLSPEWQDNVDPLTVLSDATRGFPLTCYEGDSKKERGPDNFMVSYSNLYVYEEIKNENPVIRGFKFGAEEVNPSAVCIGESCLEPTVPSSCDELPLAPRVKLCKLGGASDCQEYAITPILDELDNSEFDDIASRVGGGNEQLREQMWIRYYADRGDIKNDAKRLQDATEGWFAEHDTKWTAPSEGKAGDIVHIWSVVYDNRGGVDWARISVCLED